MSRKLIAALFIYLLFGFQATRLLNYLNCRTRNINDNSTKCDCEKQVIDIPANDHQPFSQKAISGEKADDPFLGCSGLTAPATLASPLKVLNISFLDVILRTGINSSVFQPPRYGITLKA